MTKVFISYSHKDKRWLDRLRVHLQPLEGTGSIDVFADKDITPGDEWLKRIETALDEARVAILLVSADFLASDFIKTKELPVLLQKANRKQCSILSLIIGPCLFLRMRDLQEFQAINPPDKPLSTMKKPDAEAWLVKTAEIILRYPEKPIVVDAAKQGRVRTFLGEPRIDELIKGVELADWDAAADAALKVIGATTPDGQNPMFEELFKYRDCPGDDGRFWGALQTLESCTRLAPWLITQAQLRQLAAHHDFSVRSSAASICMNWAQFAPERVPLDILQKLSVYNEDWYVQAPANAALKAMARAIPEVLHIFYSRLHSQKEGERDHAATALEDVGKVEPNLIDPQLLIEELRQLKALGDMSVFRRIRRVWSNAKSAPRTNRYRYGI